MLRDKPTKLQDDLSTVRNDNGEILYASGKYQSGLQVTLQIMYLGNPQYKKPVVAKNLIDSIYEISMKLVWV